MPSVPTIPPIRPPGGAVPDPFRAVLRKKVGLKDAPDLGGRDDKGGFWADAHQLSNDVDTWMSRVGFGAGLTSAALDKAPSAVAAMMPAGAPAAVKAAMPWLAKASTGLSTGSEWVGKATPYLNAGRALFDAARILSDTDHRDEILNEAGSGESSAVRFALGAVDPGNAPTTVTQMIGMANGLVDQRRDASDQKAANQSADDFQRLRNEAKKKHPFTYGAGDHEIPMPNPAHQQEIDAAQRAFGDEDPETQARILFANYQAQHLNK